MNNALIADGVIVILLIAGVVIGAKRGLIRSLMGLFVVVGALIGATMLANNYTDPITDKIAPKIEDTMVEKFSEELQKTSFSLELDSDVITDALQQVGLPPQVGGLLGGAMDALNGIMTSAKAVSGESFRSSISSSVHTIVRKAVHTALTLLGFLALVVVLKIVALLIDHAFNLPLLDMTNAVGGGMMGLLEAATLIYIILFFAICFGVTVIRDWADQAYLLPYFLIRIPA